MTPISGAKVHQTGCLNPFVGNPDLVRRMRDDIALSPSKRDLYYQGGAEGYTDYPAAP
jgi:N-ethylmaleimide reductase